MSLAEIGKGRVGSVDEDLRGGRGEDVRAAGQRRRAEPDLIDAQHRRDRGDQHPDGQQAAAPPEGLEGSCEFHWLVCSGAVSPPQTNDWRSRLLPLSQRDQAGRRLAPDPGCRRSGSRPVGEGEQSQEDSPGSRTRAASISSPPGPASPAEREVAAHSEPPAGASSSGKLVPDLGLAAPPGRDQARIPMIRAMNTRPARGTEDPMATFFPTELSIVAAFAGPRTRNSTRLPPGVPCLLLDRVDHLANRPRRGGGKSSSLGDRGRAGDDADDRQLGRLRDLDAVGMDLRGRLLGAGRLSGKWRRAGDVDLLDRDPARSWPSDPITRPAGHVAGEDAGARSQAGEVALASRRSATATSRPGSRSSPGRSTWSRLEIEGGNGLTLKTANREIAAAATIAASTRNRRLHSSFR